MPDLILDPDYEHLYASWNVTLMRRLAESGVFNVRHANMPRIPRKLYGRRSSSLSMFRVDGLLLALDTWDTDGPLSECLERGEFTESMAGVRMILKIQHRPDNPRWATCPVPVTSWGMFPSQEFPLGYFRYDPGYAHKWSCTVNGAARFGRGAFRVGGRVHASDGKLTFAEYFKLLRECRWGVSLKGKRGTDGKNRREVEFSSCGMPLALNYEPCYPFPFRAGKEFFLLTGADSLREMDDTDPRPFREASEAVYERYFSPKGLAGLLLDLLSAYCP